VDRRGEIRADPPRGGDFKGNEAVSAGGNYRLYGAKGSGSMIVEAAFGIARIAVETIDLDWDDVGWQSRTLADLNPLGQVPTLVLPNDGVMTESAAMILHLADIAPDCGLVPAPTHPQRTAFLRWLVFLASAVYPTFTYGDDPKRWLAGDEVAGKLLRESTDLRSKGLGSSVRRSRRSISTFGR